MKNAIILHGAPEKENYYSHDLPSESNAHWLPWLQKELMIRDIKADTPEIPHAYEPQWELWCREVERYDITPETILVGHSFGAGFWLRYLSEHADLHVGRVVLVGPWLDPDRTLREHVFAAEFDPELDERTRGLTIFYSDDDSGNVLTSLDRIRREVPGADWKEFKGYGHFTYDNLLAVRSTSGGTSFPELLEECLL